MKLTYDRPVFVCGAPRSGTSMTMQMLAAGGLPTCGEYPAYEPDEVSVTGRNMVRLARQGVGRAAKILDPHRTPGWAKNPKPFVIWTRRMYRPQAQSQAKFLRLLGVNLVSVQIDGLEASLPATELEAFALFRRVGIDDVLDLSFETTIQNPHSTAAAMAAAFGPGFDAAAAAGAVRSRTLGCLAGMLEFDLLEFDIANQTQRSGSG